MIITNHDIVVLCQFEPPTLISPQVAEEQEESAPRGLTESAPRDQKESIAWDLMGSSLEAQLESLPGVPMEICYIRLHNTVLVVQQ